MAKTRIVFLVLPRTHLLDLAGPVQVFYEAPDQIALEYCSYEGDLETSAGFPLGKLQHFSDVKLRAGDYLVIPGSEIDYLHSRSLAAQRDVFRWVRAAHQNGATICSICTGAFFLGSAGLLDGRKCTTHWKRTTELKETFPSIQLVEDVLFTEDDRILTSAGVTAGIDLALHILGRITNERTSFAVAREMVVYIRRQGSDSQQSIFMKYRNHIHSGIHKVQDYLQDHVNRRSTLTQLADEACMSTRSLTRTFKKETGVTINEYVTLIRRARLAELSKNPDISRRQMARYCGLKSERQVIRLLKMA